MSTQQTVRENIVALRMQRQCLDRPADVLGYEQLYRDIQPGKNVYWNGFGDPPSITFRAEFDDIEFNRRRQLDRRLVKGRFQGGNLGWVLAEDMELFGCLYQKPISRFSQNQSDLLELIRRQGPLTIQQIKEETGLLVRQITPVLHRLQQAFLIYEDQYDGEWDRGWYRFEEMFPEVELDRYSPVQALKKVLKGFAYRLVAIDEEMVRSYYKLPVKLIRQALGELLAEGMLIEVDGGYVLAEDAARLDGEAMGVIPGVYAMHLNDILVRANAHRLTGTFPAGEYQVLQYLLIDGAFGGAVLGKFKNGSYILEDVHVKIEHAGRKDEIIHAIYRVNDRQRSPLQRFIGTEP